MGGSTVTGDLRWQRAPSHYRTCSVCPMTDTVLLWDWNFLTWLILIEK